MPDEPEAPVELYRASGLPEAHALQIRLETEGIAVHIDNELLQGVVGELPMGWSTAPRLYVSRKNELAARAIVEGHFKRIAKSRDDAEQALSCLNCGSPMGESTCASCGWSYGSEAVETDGARPAESSNEGEQPSEVPSEGTAFRSHLATRALWLELTAVLAVGVIPNLVSAVYSLSATTVPRVPYWVNSLEYIVTSCCAIFVTVYLMHRSGDSLARFGIARWDGWDFPLAALLLILAELIWVFVSGILPPSYHETSSSSFPAPRGFLEGAMMILQYLVAASAEEIVTRAYLITRLRILLGSTAKAVLVAAIAFASYHAYQGVAGTAYAFLFGLAYGIAFLMIGRIWPLALAHALYNMRVEILTW